MSEITGLWSVPASITRNNFVNKSLSSWAFNTAIGCAHACRFCYVPDVSTIKLAEKLKSDHGVDDPDAQWGDYVLFRPWHEHKFMASLKKAEETPLSELNKDGNRAVMLCTTTDPYQTVKDPQKQQHSRDLVRRALELIRDRSTLNVRILTRSPLAKLDFDLFKSFGPRLLFGISLPTLRNDLAKIYEPNAPAPTQRISCLKAAKAAGLHVYVAMAPTYPECDADDLDETLSEIKALDPVTVFHEPINIRAENVARISSHAKSLGVNLDTSVFESNEAWLDYSLKQLLQVQEAAEYRRLPLHLWPDAAMGTVKAIAQAQYGGHRQNHKRWLDSWWNRISEWPK